MKEEKEEEERKETMVYVPSIVIARRIQVAGHFQTNAPNDLILTLHTSGLNVHVLHENHEIVKVTRSLHRGRAT